MRVGLFSNAYRPVVSGVVNSLDEIRKGLLKRGHTPFLFAPEVKGYREAHAGVFRFPSLDLDPSVEFPVPIPFSARLSRLVPRMGLDLIHSHHPILIGATAANFSKRLDLPLVYTFHTQIEQYTHYVPFFKQKTVQDAARVKVSRYLAKSALVICPSPSIRDLIDSYGVSCRVETVPNAIDLDKFLKVDPDADSLRERLGLGKNTLISLSVGRLASEKGLPFLLHCFKSLAENPDHHLVFVGSGPQKKELEGLALSLGLQEQTHFLGSVPYCEMPSLYAQSDIFVMCSTTEVKPLVVLEAMASGLPILAVAACGTADTLTHNKDGLLCQLDASGFSRFWEQLLSQAELRRHLSKGGRATAQLYSIENYLDTLCRLYRETIESHQAHKRNRSITG